MPLPSTLAARLAQDEREREFLGQGITVPMSPGGDECASERVSQPLVSGLSVDLDYRLCSCMCGCVCVWVRGVFAIVWNCIASWNLPSTLAHLRSSVVYIGVIGAWLRYERGYF